MLHDRWRSDWQQQLKQWKSFSSSLSTVFHYCVLFLPAGVCSPVSLMSLRTPEILIFCECVCVERGLFDVQVLAFSVDICQLCQCWWGLSVNSGVCVVVVVGVKFCAVLLYYPVSSLHKADNLWSSAPVILLHQVFQPNWDLSSLWSCGFIIRRVLPVTDKNNQPVLWTHRGPLGYGCSCVCEEVKILDHFAAVCCHCMLRNLWLAWRRSCSSPTLHIFYVFPALTFSWMLQKVCLFNPVW